MSCFVGRHGVRSVGLDLCQIGHDHRVSCCRLGSGKAFEIATGIAAIAEGGLVVVGSTARGAGRTTVWIIRLVPDRPPRSSGLLRSPRRGHVW